jgi:osmoprotectant transport system permease protein
VVGLRGVDAAVLEAADGVGMTARQRLWRVELPLALPVIIAGVRTAAVWTVGMATLATPVGATGLGNYIFAGLQTRNVDAILVGCAAAAALALALDGLIQLLAAGVARRRRGLVAAAGLALAGLAIYAGAGLIRGAAAGRADVVIGAKPFTEQYVLAEILAGRVGDATGRSTAILPSLGSTVAFDALRAGDLDLYVDYSGTLWTTILGRTDRPDRAALLAAVDGELRERGITVVGALGFENAYCLAMRRADAERRGIRSIADLARAAPDLRIGGDYEFFARAEWTALRATYGLRFAGQRTMDPSLMYQAAAAGDVDVISAYSTDGRIAAFDLVVLADDRGAIPPYDAVILAPADLSADLRAALQPLLGAIDADAMRALNRAVDDQGRSPRAAARDFLDRLRSSATPPPGG